jgi:hypothetical protein
MKENGMSAGMMLKVFGTGRMMGSLMDYAPRGVAAPGRWVLLPPPAEYRSAMFCEPYVSILWFDLVSTSLADGHF